MRLYSDVSAHIADPLLRRAFVLALRGEGATAPNPPVGCVIVKDGVIVGEGLHPRAGEPHAEVFALQAAGSAARESDAYVTLEPCLHHGRTPPCADALIAAGVRRVFIGCADPTAEAGGGAEVLRAAGIEVMFAEDSAVFETLVEGWRSRSLRGHPFVTVKVALSLDGRPALTKGQRSAITGASGGLVTSSLRSRADAVLVGASTIAIDDPALTARDCEGRRHSHQPLRVVLARETVPAPDARVFSDREAPTLLLVGSGAAHARLQSLPGHVLVDRYDAAAGLSDALAVLAAHGVNELLVEAGPTLLSALWTEGFVDQLITVTAGGMAGGGAPALFEGDPDTVERESDPSIFDGGVLAHRLTPVEAGIVGDVAIAAWRSASSVYPSTAHDAAGATQPIT